MANSLVERLYGGLWGGAIAQTELMDPLNDKPNDEQRRELARVQDFILSGDSLRRHFVNDIEDWELEGDWAVSLQVVFEAEQRSIGDWAIAFPWAIQRSPMPKATGLWLGTLLGMRGGTRSIPVGLRVTHREIGIQMRSQAEAMVRSQGGIGAIVMPILGQ